MTMDMIDNTLRSLLIDAALAEAEESEGKEYSPTDRFKLALNKALKSRGFDPFYTFFAIKRRRALAIIAAVAAALALTMSVGAIRERVVNFFIEIFDTYAVITTDKNPDYPKTIKEQYAPSYIPEGFVLNNTSEHSLIFCIEWKNNNDQYIFFKQITKNSKMNINATRVEEISIFKENDGISWKSSGLRSVSFETNGYYFVIDVDSAVSEDEIIKIAKSIEKYEFTKS